MSAIIEESTENDGNLAGSCLCGSNSFSISASLIRFGFASCHCSICRSAHASPFVLWSGMSKENSKYSDFILSSKDHKLSLFQSSPICNRYFCSNCGTQLYIRYNDSEDPNDRWSGEIHFPTSVLDQRSLKLLEKEMAGKNKPRFLHVFFPGQENSYLGDLSKWAGGPKYGGVTGLEPLE